MKSSIETSPLPYARLSGVLYLAIIVVFYFLLRPVSESLALLAPPIAASLFPGILLPAFVAELSLCLWLIAKGVNMEQWTRRVLQREAASVQA